MGQFYKKLGFSLIELMVVVVIIGILAVLALPAYKKYVIKSKLSEAYSIVEVIGKNQVTYFNENKEFFNVTTANPTYLDSGQIVNTSAWTDFGYAAPIGSNMFFTYRSRAGKIDGTGTEITSNAASVSGYGFTTLSAAILGSRYSTGEQCNTSETASTLGLSASNNLDWTVITAVADMNGNKDSTCTAVARILQSSEVSNKIPGFLGGFITFNIGE